MKLKPAFLYTLSLLLIGVVAWAAIPEQNNRDFNIPGELTPELVQAIDEDNSDETESLIWEFGKISSGDNLSKIFHKIAPEIFNSYVLASSFSENFNNRLSLNQRFRYRTESDPITNATTLVFELFDKDLSSVKGVEFYTQRKPSFYEDIVNFKKDTVSVSIPIQGTLSQSLRAMGEKQSLSTFIQNVFSKDLNTSKDLKKGDEFRLLVVKKYGPTQEFHSYGKILSVWFRGEKISKELFAGLYATPNGGEHYFDQEGKSLETTFLNSPLQDYRISSKFNPHRLHPILKVVRPHNGVDYTAPMGTPIKATGDGVVAFVGTQRGYGRLVQIKHAAGIETFYAHLKGYARGLRKGQKVRKGQVIAFLGNSGLSSGAHLHYGFKRNDRFVDPLKQDFPAENMSLEPNDKLLHQLQMFEYAEKLQIRASEGVAFASLQHKRSIQAN